MEMDEEWCLDYKGEMGSSRLGKGECVCNVLCMKMR